MKWYGDKEDSFQFASGTIVLEDGTRKRVLTIVMDEELLKGEDNDGMDKE